MSNGRRGDMLKPVAYIDSTPTIEVDTFLLPGGETWLGVRMVTGDYDEYRSLPNRVTYRGVRFIKAGWNSDSMMASYGPESLPWLRHKYAEIVREPSMGKNSLDRD